MIPTNKNLKEIDELCLTSSDYEDKLRSFCEGLEMCNIDILMTGTVGDFRRIGEIMTTRIKELEEYKWMYKELCR